MQAGRLRSSGMPTQSVAAADRMVQLPRPFSPTRPPPVARGGYRVWNRENTVGAALSAARVQMRPCEPAALPWPVAERNEPDALRKSAPALRNNPRPPPARAADRPTPTARFCSILKALLSGSPPDVVLRV